MEPTPNTDNAPLQTVEAPAARDPAVRKFILSAMLLAFGLWCVNDLHKYPYKPAAENFNAFAGWLFNHTGAVALPIAGLIVLAIGLLQLRRKLLADADGIGYVGKPKIAWKSITKVDASALQSKGVLVLHHGQDGKLTLDSWKLQNFRDLVAYVESHVPAEALQ